jgi:hypothetical protein
MWLVNAPWGRKLFFAWMRARYHLHEQSSLNGTTAQMAQRLKWHRNPLKEVEITSFQQHQAD